MIHMMKLLQKDLKATIIPMLHEVKVNSLENRVPLWKIEIIQKNQMEILHLKN